MALPLFTRAYMTRSRPGSASRCSRPTSSSPAKQTTSRTSKLRSRLAKSKDAAVCPELAAQVVKEYLIPLFEAEVRSGHNRRREATFRQDLSRSSEATKKLNASTVYEELKLSEQLKDEICSLRTELREATTRAQEAEQVKESLTSELRYLTHLRDKSVTDLSMIKASFAATERNFQEQEIELLQIQSQLSEMHKLYSAAEVKCHRLSVFLHEEKALSDKLKNKALELEHTNDLLRLENSIMGEQLKGLYQAISRISACRFAEGLVAEEVRFMSQSLKAAIDTASGLEHELKRAVADRDELRENLTEAILLRDDMQTDRARFYKQANDKLNSLQSRLQTTEEERERLRVDAQKYEKRFKDLSEEYEKLRARMNQYRLKRKQYGEVEEKMCRLCQKVYNEAENFNWSCRTHCGEFGGEMWWCCGKTGRDAAGCKTCKHESKDDDALAKDKDELEHLRLASVQCPSCKEFGHRPGDCPKDPNLRSKFDLCKEMDRIEHINKFKKIGGNTGVSPELARSLLIEKSKLDDFHREAVATSPVSSALDSEDEEKDSESLESSADFFHGIKKLQRRVTHDPTKNLIQFREFTEKSGTQRHAETEPLALPVVSEF